MRVLTIHVSDEFHRKFKYLSFLTEEHMAVLAREALAEYLAKRAKELKVDLGGEDGRP